MVYLLDANFLIDADRDYYPVQVVPEFWAWLINTGINGKAKIPLEIYEELTEGDLGVWARMEEVKAALMLDEEVNPSLVARVVDEGYAPDLADDEVPQIGRDPFLIAYAMVSVVDRCVVTTEKTKPTKQRANRRIPDVCKTFGVTCHDPFRFLRDLGFKTNWKAA